MNFITQEPEAGRDRTLGIQEQPVQHSKFQARQRLYSETLSQKNWGQGAGEMAQWLRELETLPENPGSSLSSLLPVTPVPGNPINRSLVIYWHQEYMWYAYIYADKYYTKNKCLKMTRYF